MSIEDLVQHMANITFIFDHHERLGTTKSPLLIWEFEQCATALAKAIQEKADETRKRKLHGSGSQDRAGIESGKPGGGESDRDSHVEDGRPDRSGPGVQSSDDRHFNPSLR